MVITVNLWHVIAGIVVGGILILCTAGVVLVVQDLREDDSRPIVHGASEVTALATVDGLGATGAVFEGDETTPTEPAHTPSGVCDPSVAVPQVRRAVVRIQTTTSVGTGFIIDGEGVVITNAHVVGFDSAVALTLSDGNVVMAPVIARDAHRDLASISIGFVDFPPAVLSTEPSLAPGTRLLAWGYALDLPGEPSLTSGAFSSRRSLDGVDYIQTDTALNPGNSGGPLFTECGAVVGVVVGGFRDAEGLNLAVSASEVLDFIRSGPSRSAPVVETITPAETVALFYSLLHQRLFESAFDLLSTGFKGDIALQTFINGYATTQSIAVEEVIQTGPDSVEVKVLATDLIDGRLLIRRFAGTWKLVQESGRWKLHHGQIAVVSSNEVEQSVNYAGRWRITDTVTSGLGQGQTFQFDVQIYQSGNDLLGLSENLVFDGWVSGNRIYVTFVQLDQAIEGYFDWTMASPASGSGTFGSSIPNSGTSTIQRIP